MALRRPSPTADRTLAVASAGAVAVFLLLVLVARPFYPSYDESKYVSIGANLWAGRGPVTAFGDLFLSHAPLWSALLYAPTALAHVDAYAWGHLLDALAGAGVVALAAVMARRASPLAGVIAASAMLAFTYLLDLSRTARLDVPVAFLTLLYLEVGWRAVRSGSVRWALAAGAVFAVGVWVKEVPIPVAPAPMIAAILAGVAWPRLAKATGLIVLAALVLLLPWFAIFAGDTGTVYRLGFRAWTLGPLVVGIAAFGLVCAAAERLATRPEVERLARRAAGRSPWLSQHGRALAGWAAAIIWAVAFLVFFSHVGRVAIGGLLQLSQIRHNLGTWVSALAPITAFTAVGGVAAVAMLLVDRSADERLGVRNAIVATVCGAPLVLMVIAVGEPPRNYIAQVATAVVVGAGGWSWAITRAVRRLATSRPPEFARRSTVVVALLVLALGAGALTVRAYRTRQVTVTNSERAVEAAVSWIRSNVPTGSTVAFGAYLSFSMADGLVPDYTTVQLQARLSTADPTYPEAFRWGKEPPSTDWVAVDTAPRNVNQYEAYRAAWVSDEIAQHDIAYWVYATGASTAAPSILGQLTPAHGFTPVASWTYGTAKSPLAVTIFRVDRANVRLDPAQLFISPEALARVTAALRAAPAQGRGAAGLLVDRVQVIPASASADAALQELRTIAGR